MSGADLEYAAMLALAGKGVGTGLDGARLEQLVQQKTISSLTDSAAITINYNEEVPKGTSALKSVRRTNPASINPFIVGSYVGAGSTASSVGNPKNALVHPDTKPGDWVFVAITHGTAGTFTFPAGWTKVLDNVVLLAGEAAVSLIYRRWRQDDIYLTPFDLNINARFAWMATTVRGGSTIVVGAPGQRGTVGTATTCVAPSINLPTANGMIIAFSFESTTAAETDVNSIAGANEVRYWRREPGTANYPESVCLASKTYAAPGATSIVTFTYPNSSTTKGLAIQIGFTVPDTAQEQETLFVPPRQTLTQLLASPMFYMGGHRGASQNKSEGSLSAYTFAVWHGAPCVEISWQKSKEGIRISSHDTTTGRIANNGQNLTISQEAASTILGMLIDIPEQVVNTPQEAQQMDYYTSVEAILNAYGQTHCFAIDPKGSETANEALDFIESFIPNAQQYVMFKGDGNAISLNTFAAAQARGYKTWGYFTQAQLAAIPGKISALDYLGLNYDADQPSWTTALSYGKRVFSHVPPTRQDALDSIAKGATGMNASNVRDIIPRINFVR